MPENRNPAATDGFLVRSFHNATNHNAHVVGLDERYAQSMIPELRPRPYKLYPTLSPLPLPRDDARSTLPALEAIADAHGTGGTGDRIPDIDALATLLLLTDGVTRRLTRNGRTIDFRAAPCTGALYHAELYLACGNLPGLPAGVYHYGPLDHALRQLRQGDLRAHIVEASGDEPALAEAPAILITTSVYWRNAWKYLDRAYRHTWWDSGTMLPNTLALAAAMDLPARIILGFADEPVAELIDVDLDHEGVISLVALGRTASKPAPSPPIQRLDLPTEPYSIREVDLPLIPDTHRATLLRRGEDAASWREATPPAADSAPGTGVLIDLPRTDSATLLADPIEEVILRRGSTRQFAREPMTFEQLSILLDRTTRGIPTDSLGPEGIPLNTAYLIVNDVAGLEPGTYVYHPGPHALEWLQSLPGEDVRERAAFLALEQDLGGDAAVNIYFLTGLDPILERYGERGYRLAQLGGALVAGKMYLAAYALGLGATGLTFFDDAVPEFFGPHAAGKDVMFLIAIGVPQRKQKRAG